MDTSRPLASLEALDSPERVRLELELAGPMSRAFAFSLDYSIILIVILIGILLLVSGSQQVFEWLSGIRFVQDLFDRLADWLNDPEATEQNVMVRGVVIAVVAWMLLDLFMTTAYFLFFETLFQGRTPGKRWTQLRVIREDGGTLGWGESLLRNLMRTVDALPAGYLFGAIAMLISPRVQRLGDLVAGTLVIRERESLALERLEEVVVPSALEAAFRFTRDELASIGEVERRLIRRTLARVDTLSERAALPIVDRATQAISARMGRENPVPPAEQRDFLRALLQAAERLL